VNIVERVAGTKLRRKYDPEAPKGVAGRNSDNTMIKRILGWEPTTPLSEGIARTYRWIEEQYRDRKAGKPTVS
jgi:nucleoside-diphosphate-sugar epimerase